MVCRNKSIFVFISIVVFSGLISCCIADKSNRQKLNFNGDWKFCRGELAVDDVIKMNYDDSNWENVHLPHAPKMNPLRHRWPLPDNQGINWYRKQFQLPKNYEGKKIFIEFEATDQVADVWINGEKLITHAGAFTPFLIDITDHVQFGRTTNLVCLRVNNKRNPDIPVYGSWISYGGLYRDVYLHVMDHLHITDPIYANKIAGGGIFVTYPVVADSLAEVKVQTNIFNEYQTANECRLISSIRDAHNKKVGSAESVHTINGEADHSFIQTIKINNPKLWHPDHPNRYTLISEVFDDDSLVDIQTTRIGIRRIDFSTEDGFSLNGKRLVFIGSNRVQDYPYVAWAFPNAAQRRDAIHLKQVGFQYVRLSHNLQDPSFLDACDELGILVMACIPGFQYIGGQKFREHSFQDMRDLIRRDRNHPSVILWELSLNETDFDSSFAETAMQIGHEEFPGDQCFVSGWKFDDIYDVYIRATQHGARNYRGNAPLVISEYGHWDYGGGNSTSDVDRKDGERAMLIQAKNHQESLNANRALPFLCGDGLWVGMDFQTYPSGVIDYFRLPKFSYYFFQSQRDPYLKIDGIDSGPMIFSANYWTETSPRDVTVFSNCDSVRLLLNRELIGTQPPNRNSISDHLLHPPFTFKNTNWEPGELKAIGFLDGAKIVQHVRLTPEQAHAIELQFEINYPPKADGEDLFFVYANIVDQNGTIVHSFSGWIDFEVEGAAKLVSPNRIQAEAGIAAALIRVGQKPGKIIVKAVNPELNSGVKTITCR
jgi:beta-galactosidase